jgi:periplasmic protein TonB
MNSKINIYSQDWCDMVFDDKNKEYGAYVLREKSGKRHFRALIIASVCFVLAISTPLILKKIIPKKKEANVEVTTMTDIKVDKKEEKKNAAEEIKLPDVPLKNTIQYVPPVIKPDEEVPDDQVIKTQDELNQSNTAISIKDQKGVDEGGVDVADLDKGAESIVNDEEAPFDVVENSPDFPGGDLALRKFLKDNLQYPKLAYETGIEGTVYVEFVVSKIGKISNVKLKRGIGGNCDEEAMRVVKMMPSWNPGRQNGENVPVKFVLPVNFKLK